MKTILFIIILGCLTGISFAQLTTQQVKHTDTSMGKALAYYSWRVQQILNQENDTNRIADYNSILQGLNNGSNAVMDLINRDYLNETT